MNKGPGIIFFIFMVTWVILGIASSLFFFLNRDAALKRKLFRPFIWLVGLLFLGFMALTGVPWQAFIVAVPAALLISFINIRSTVFCDSCGRTIINHFFWAKAEYCARCGAKLLKEGV